MTVVAKCLLYTIAVDFYVHTPLQQFDQRSLARFIQTVSKIEHTLKNLKSQGPLKKVKTRHKKLFC